MPYRSANAHSVTNAFDVVQYSPTEGDVGTEITVDIRLTESAFSQYQTIALRLVFGSIAVETAVTQVSTAPSGYKLQGRAPPDKPTQRAIGRVAVTVQIVTQDNTLLDEAVFGSYQYLRPEETRRRPPRA